MMGDVTANPEDYPPGLRVRFLTGARGRRVIEVVGTVNGEAFRDSGGAVYVPVYHGDNTTYVHAGNIIGVEPEDVNADG